MESQDSPFALMCTQISELSHCPTAAWTCSPAVCTCAQSRQSCSTLQDAMDCSPPGSSVHGIFQTRILEWVAISFFHDNAAAAAAKSLQSCPTLCDSIDGSPPGSPVPGILKARTLEWVAIFFSSGYSYSLSNMSFKFIFLESSVVKAYD